MLYIFQIYGIINMYICKKGENLMKRLLALILVATLMLSLFPVVSAAPSAEEDYASLRELFGELHELQDGRATRNSTAVSDQGATYLACCRR